MIMVKTTGSLVKEAIVNTTLGMILGCGIVILVMVWQIKSYSVWVFALLVLTREVMRDLGVG